MAMCFSSEMAPPVRGLNSVSRSISSPKNSTRTALSVALAGKISTTSPRTRNLLRMKFTSLRSYCSSTSFFKSSSRSFSMPGRREMTMVR